MPGLTPIVVTATMNPPKIAIASEKTVTTGSMNVAATTRGTTRKRTGLIAHRAQRVDLLGDLHGAELGGDRGSHAPADHERGQHRARAR